MSRATARIVAAGFAATLAIGGLVACSDEDGDGATTDEELQDVEDGAEDVGNQVEEEVEGQDEGSNEDGE
jgi:hypothetical protein